MHEKLIEKAARRKKFGAQTLCVSVHINRKLTNIATNAYVSNICMLFSLYVSSSNPKPNRCCCSCYHFFFELSPNESVSACISVCVHSLTHIWFAIRLLVLFVSQFYSVHNRRVGKNCIQTHKSPFTSHRLHENNIFVYENFRFTIVNPRG